MTKVTTIAPAEFSREFAFEERHNVAQNYVDQLSDYEATTAEAIADDLLQNRGPLANTVVIIPVAAGQEADNILHTVSEYADQQRCEPFTVVLGLNVPSDNTSSSEVHRTIVNTEVAKKIYSSLDIRTTFMIYDQPVIGAIRRDLWNGVTAASLRTGNFLDGEVIGINHDIDLGRLATGYIGNVQKYYNFRDGRHIVTPVSPPRGSMTKHAYSPKHPNTSRAVFWNDFYYRKLDAAYEAGLIIPLSFYTTHGGFDANARTHEVGGLTAKALRRPSLLAGTYMETSPRRYLARIDQHGYDIWSPDSFTAEDPCRERADFPDISKERQLEIVEASISTYAGTLTMQALGRGCEKFDRANMDRLVEGQERLTARDLDDFMLIETEELEFKACGILERVISSPKLADKFYDQLRKTIFETLKIKIEYQETEASA